MKFRLSHEEILAVYSNNDVWWWLCVLCPAQTPHWRIGGAEFQPIIDLITNLEAWPEFSWGECQTPSLFKGNVLTWVRVILISCYHWNLALIRIGNVSYSGCFTLPIETQCWEIKWMSVREQSEFNTPLFQIPTEMTEGRKLVENIKITYKTRKNPENERNL